VDAIEAMLGGINKAIAVPHGTQVQGGLLSISSSTNLKMNALST
jgi:hypothetical protein